ncbi:MAG: transglutaminase domain-containing protein [Flavobacteriaceae bacterium]
MKRTYKVLIFVLFLAFQSFSQEWANVDGKVKTYPQFSSITDLGYRIMNDFQKDEDRVRAAFIWLTEHIAFADQPMDSHQFERISFRSSREKEQKISAFVFSRVDKAFHLRQGVCIDYSLMLNALLEQFKLPAKVISGIARSKVTDIEEIPRLMNHSWNAVRVNGKWKLMDATWAAGYVSEESKKFIRSFMGHYFFTPPSEFVLNHLPTNQEWQLLDTPITMANFVKAPVHLPEYFNSGISLSSKTKGTLVPKDLGDNFIYFDALPKQHLMHYTINDSPELKRMGFRKLGEEAYVSKIRIRGRLKAVLNYLTIYHSEQPVLRFRIEKHPNFITDTNLSLRK